MHTGRYGVSSDIIGKDNGDFRYSREDDDADTLPLYFNILIPANRSEGLCILESYGRQTPKQALESCLSRMVKSLNSKLKFQMINFAPKDEIINQIEIGELNKIKTTKYYEKSLSEDKVNAPNSGIRIQESDEEYLSTLGFKSIQKIYQLSERSKTQLKDGLVDVIRNERVVSEIIEFEDDYDVIKFEYCVENSNKTLDFENRSKFKCSRDISDINTDDRNHPIYNAIHNKGEDMLHEFMCYLTV